jgi:ligand-binding sensor domain-containing protein
MGGSDTEVWVFASNNSSTGGNQILRYNIVDTSFIGFVDNTNSTLPVNFTAKAIYYDSVGKRWWVGMLSDGIYVYNTTMPGWSHVNFNNIFPSGTFVNNHAITGDTKGNIYIGTSTGLVYFGSSSSSAVLNPLDPALYTKYNLSNGFISDNVRSIAVDYRASRIIVATDSGIAFKYSLCKECINKLPVYTVAAGNWNNPASWPDGILPVENDVVIIRHPIVITQNTNIKSLRVIPPGSITVNSGVQFNVQGVKYEAEGW